MTKKSKLLTFSTQISIENFQICPSTIDLLVKLSTFKLEIWLTETSNSIDTKLLSMLIKIKWVSKLLIPIAIMSLNYSKILWICPDLKTFPELLVLILNVVGLMSKIKSKLQFVPPLEINVKELSSWCSNLSLQERIPLTLN